VTKRRADEQQTRRRILDAATRQFVVKGYKHVTIREICREARANVAAVNYHFRD
jgi:AcrR family transcriptional regulator